MRLSQRASELLSGQNFYTLFTKGHNSVENVGGVSIFVLCTFSGDTFYICLCQVF